jgi:hypothetical protein
MTTVDPELARRLAEQGDQPPPLFPLGAAALAELLAAHRMVWSSEDQLQAGIAAALAAAGIAHEREVRLSPRNRVDLLVGRVAVEVKVARRTALGDIAAQLGRYAASPDVDELLLVTTRPQHQALPAEVGRKPLHVLVMRGAG